MTGDRPRNEEGKFLPTGEARDKNLIIRMTEAEKQAFYQASREAGYRPTELVRELIADWIKEHEAAKAQRSKSLKAA